MSEEHCSVDFGDRSNDADPCEFFDVTHPRARREHQCSECRGTIPAGATYTKVAWKFEGAFGMDKVCGPCWEAMQEFDYHIFGGSFWNEMQDAWEQGANVQGCINRLVTVEAKTHMHRRWMQWKFPETK